MNDSAHSNSSVAVKPYYSLAKLVSLLVLGVLIVPQQATSHHSFPYLYTADGEETISVIEGSVRIFRILNPHSALIVDVTDDSGSTEGWFVELSPSAQLAREGWVDDTLVPGDEVSAAIVESVTPKRSRLRAVLINGETENEAARLMVAYGIRGNSPIIRRLRERLPVCSTIDASYNRTECFLVESEALLALQEEFPGPMGYVMP